MAATESLKTYTCTCVIYMKEYLGYSSEESSQTYTQTCVIIMKEQGGYGHDRIFTDIHSELCYNYEKVGKIWPRQNPHRHTLKIVL